MFPTILNEFFVQRTSAWFRIVIQEGLGFQHFWYRFEFAKSRGAIHFHSLLLDFDKSYHLHGSLDALRELFSAVLRVPVDFHSPTPSLSDLNELEQELVVGLAESLPQVFAPVSALHPAGRTLQPLPGHTPPPTDASGSFNFSHWAKARLAAAGAPGFTPLDALARVKLVKGDDVPYTDIGNLFLWPPHEGLGPPPNKHSLRLWPFEVPVHAKDADLIDYCNCACLHGCSSYCLRKEGKKMKCRMGFGVENETVASRCDGKPAAAAPALQVTRGVSQLAMERDHPRMVQGCPELGRSWGANTDWQVFSYTLKS
jgi:hypothetical protein